MLCYFLTEWNGHNLTILRLINTEIIQVQKLAAETKTGMMKLNE